MYCGTLAGVVFSSFVNGFEPGKEMAFQVSFETVLISAVVALALMPYVFKKLVIMPNSPLIVRLGFFVQNGIFWQVIMESIRKLP